MQESKFVRRLQVGEYVTPPNPRGIGQDTEADTELTIDEDYLWCKRTRKLDVLAGWVEKLEDGVLAVVVNPVLVKLGGAESVIGAEVGFESYAEMHCDECQEIVHTHIDCPICLNEYAETNRSGGVYEKLAEDGPFPLRCDECKTVFNVLTIDAGYIRATIGTEADKAVLTKRSEKRLERLRASGAPAALIEVEIEILDKLKGGE